MLSIFLYYYRNPIFAYFSRQVSSACSSCVFSTQQPDCPVKASKLFSPPSIPIPIKSPQLSPVESPQPQPSLIFKPASRSPSPQQVAASQEIVSPSPRFQQKLLRPSAPDPPMPPFPPSLFSRLSVPSIPPPSPPSPPPSPLPPPPPSPFIRPRRRRPYPPPPPSPPPPDLPDLPGLPPPSPSPPLPPLPPPSPSLPPPSPPSPTKPPPSPPSPTKPPTKPPTPVAYLTNGLWGLPVDIWIIAGQVRHERTINCSHCLNQLSIPLHASITCHAQVSHRHSPSQSNAVGFNDYSQNDTSPMPHPCSDPMPGKK